jgi:23S rRNA (cytosine1962-C5)-methyltransferase
MFNHMRIPAVADVFSAVLLPREERRLLRGHDWAYRNEFKRLPETGDGAVVDVFTENRRFVGRGFYQADGGIAVRLLTRHQEPIDDRFLAERVRSALRFRETLFPGSDVYRWVFGESDGLPGFVADRYGAVVSAQSSCAFYRDRSETLLGAFLEAPGVSGALFQNQQAPIRQGDTPEQIEFDLEGLRVGLALEGAQKTGMFLDQRLNRLALRPYCAGARVLDAYCHIGLWACHAAQFGAASVLGVDTSARAIEEARANAARNGVEEHCSFECADIEAVLARGDRYDVVILDPPAFAKARNQMTKALGRYQAINAAAMRAVAPGGILISCSCSHFVGREDFLDMLKIAASTAQRSACLLELRGAAPDHPVLLSMPETAYLKCAVLRML